MKVTSFVAANATANNKNLLLPLRAKLFPCTNTNPISSFRCVNLVSITWRKPSWLIHICGNFAIFFLFFFASIDFCLWHGIEKIKSIQYNREKKTMKMSSHCHFCGIYFAFFHLAPFLVHYFRTFFFTCHRNLSLKLFKYIFDSILSMKRSRFFQWKIKSLIQLVNKGIK